MKESTYQAKLMKKLRVIFPGCQIIKLDPKENQGFPDILILYNHQWAMLEVKMSATAAKQPNQRYYVEVFDEMSFASFINPNSEEQVLDDLQSTFGISRKARV